MGQTFSFCQSKGDVDMVFKKNITITIACVITECLISMIPAIFIIYGFFFSDKFDEIFSTLLIVPYFILITNVVLIIVSLISQIFVKTKYYINKQTLVVKNNSVVEIKYSDIASITYDFGYLIRHNPRPSQLVLFDKDFKQLLAVNNPSIIMVHLLKKRCKNAKTSYCNHKRLLYLLALINGVVLLFAILFKFI